MIIDERDIHGFSIEAEDGELGKADRFLFKDGDWVVRYLVVKTIKWLGGSSVLISPIAVQDIKYDDKKISVALTKKQVKESPNIVSVATVSRNEEIKLNKHYGWGPYWMTKKQHGNQAFTARQEIPWGTSVLPGLLMGQNTDMGLEPDSPDNPEKSQFRSTLEVHEYKVHANDGHIGHVENFLIDDETWQIRYVVVDTNTWWPGKKVLISPYWIMNVNWWNQEISVDIEKQVIKDGPVYDFELPITREFEEKLFRAYGKLPYWEDS